MSLDGEAGSQSPPETLWTGGERCALWYQVQEDCQPHPLMGAE